MLIVCPECKNKISDKAEHCVHCGMPVKLILENNNNMYNIKLVSIGKGKGQTCQAIIRICQYSLSEAADIVNNLSTIKSNITLDEANKIKSVIEEIGGKVSITKASNDTVEYDTDSHRESLNVPYCPKCGSTSITTGARGVDGFWGFLGASSTVNRCANCGHAWYPSSGKKI